MIIYALSLVGLFGASAAYHRLNWSPTALRRMRSLDHSMIFLLIAGTYTAFGVLVLQGLWRLLVLVVVWTGALMGITLKLVKIEGFTRVGGTLYMALGWIGIAALPQVLNESEALPLLLAAVGGLMYTAGAVVLLRRRPDPNPLVLDITKSGTRWWSLRALAITRPSPFCCAEEVDRALSAQVSQSAHYADQFTIGSVPVPR
jgi:hemolysin III